VALEAVDLVEDKEIDIQCLSLMISIFPADSLKVSAVLPSYSAVNNKFPQFLNTFPQFPANPQNI